MTTLMLFSSCMFFYSCEEKPGQAIDLKIFEGEAGTNLYEGYTSLQSTKNEVVVTYYPKPGGEASDVFVLQTNGNHQLFDQHPQGQILFNEKSLAYLTSDNTLLVFAISNASDAPLTEALKGRNVKYKLKEGFGLSHMHGAYALAPAFLSDGQFLAYHLVNSNTLLSDDKKAGLISKTNLATCSSGGDGAINCEIDEPFGGSYKVTCGDGYYACCIGDSIRCICRKNIP